MLERKKERSVRRVDNPTEPHTVEKKQGKQTKFLLDIGVVNIDPDEVEELRSEILRSSIQLLKTRGFKNLSGESPRPKIGVESFSVSFSVSFSLGA